jgi:hypothetical protein
MRNSTRISRLLNTAAFAIVIAGEFVLGVSAARAQVTGGTDRNVSKMLNYQNECAIAKNPTNKLQLFAACNNSTGGLFAARSTDGGLTWTYPDADKTIADGDAGQGPLACCDPTLAWDTFGNLFITYLGNANTVETILSTDGGLTFTNLITFGPASVDQPTVAVGAGQIWIVWNQSNQMVARGAPVTGLGTANIGAFIATLTIPNTTGCSFGDLAISPGGAVVQACETPTGGQGPATIRVNTKADGLGPNPFNAGVAATTTNVGGFDFIPAQNTRSVDAEAGLTFDRNGGNGRPTSPHFGRLYLVYTEETVNENNDTDIMVRFSDDNGATWSNPPIRVNDDATTRSQFLPRIASNPVSGNIAVCWHDARNSATNTAMQEFCTIATPTGASPAFLPNALISDGSSTGTGSSPPVAGQADIQFGDYSGLAYFQGLAHPIWADVSNSTGDNPDGTSRWDAYTDRVWGGAAANEGDPHISTVDGIHYDFQSAGEFVVLRDADGTEIQTRQTAIPTASVVGNAYTGLTTCVSLNTAVAARVNKHRVTFQPNLSGVPDPSGMQLRIDGNLTTLPANGLDLDAGGRVVSSAGGGIQVDFPDETTLIVTPGWWTSQSKWYLNVDVYHSAALEGVMGARARGSWLPALADGTSLGPKPAALHQRYIDLYQKFADSWRVTDKTSLFVYAPGTSTATFTIASWPPENPPCVLPQTTPVEPATLAVAQRVCRAVTGKNRKEDCIFDVHVTGNTGFAKTYLLSQKIQAGATGVVVSDDRDPSKPEEPVTFTATVARHTPVARRAGGAPTGTVQFTLDGEKAGGPVKLDAKGQARWKTARLQVGDHNVAAQFIPAEGTAFLPSSSADERHTVRKGN